MKRALIVGGGIGGQAAGIALRQQNIDVLITEIQPSFDVYGVGIIQQANALRALEELGVAQEAMRRGSPYNYVKMCTPSGEYITDVGTPPIDGFPSHNGISRRILHEILYEKALEMGVKYKMGASVQNIDDRKDGVSITFTDQTESDFDFVIAADGVFSVMRTMILGNYTPKYVGLSVWRYAFKRPKDLETGYMYMGKDTKVGLIPMTDDTIYMFLVSAEGADNPFIPLDELIPKFKKHLEPYTDEKVRSCIDQITDPNLVNYRPLETLMTPAPWYKNRVVFLGDAVHATIPQLGSGAALAIEDAVVLGKELGKSDNYEAIFSNYMERRHSRCKTIVDASSLVGQMEYEKSIGVDHSDAEIGKIMHEALSQLQQPI